MPALAKQWAVRTAVERAMSRSLGNLGAGLAEAEPGHGVEAQRRREIAALAAELLSLTEPWVPSWQG
jgi:hypothetical protein